MIATIKFNKDTDNSLELDELYKLLYENDIEVELVQKKSKNDNSKAIDIPIAINIANLALASMTTLITILTYFQNQNNYSISFKYKETIYTFNNLSEDEQKRKLKKILNLQDKENIEFLIMN